MVQRLDSVRWYGSNRVCYSVFACVGERTIEWVWWVEATKKKTKRTPLCTKCELMCFNAIHCLVQFFGIPFFFSLSFSTFSTDRHFVANTTSKSVCLMVNMRFLRKLYSFSRALTCLITALFRSLTLPRPFILCVYAILWMAAPCTSSCHHRRCCRWTVNKSFAPRKKSKSKSERKKKYREQPTLANGKNVNVALKRTNNRIWYNTRWYHVAMHTWALDKNRRKKLLLQIGLCSEK